VKGGSVGELSILLEPRILPLFFHFLQDGFLVETAVGCSILEFLTDRCRLSHETVSNRISTVILDGHPVDDLEYAVVKHDATLALSGAMPGLVGAVMRSNSPLRSFRDSITHRYETVADRKGRGVVRLKLFNTVMKDLGPSLLAEGILLHPSVVTHFLAKRLDGCGNGIREVLVDRKAVDIALLLDRDLFGESDLVSLSVRPIE